MKPIILEYAVEQHEEIAPVYEYDYNKGLNVINVEGTQIPFIDYSFQEINLLTKTRVRSESDDSSVDIFELLTKTKVKNENDDDNFYLELKTKTLVARESDDERIGYN